MSTDQANTAAAAATSTQPQAPAPGQSVTPTSNPNAEGLLRQVDSVNSKLEETQKREAAALAQAQNAAARANELEARLARQAERYAKAQMPKAEAFIKHMEEALKAEGRTMDEASKKKYISAFTNPDHEEDAAQMWATHEHTVKLAASAKAKEDQLKEQEAENARLKETLAKANQTLANGSRSNYVEAIAASAASNANDTEETVTIAASGRARQTRSLAAGEIMVAAPAVSELPFLKEAGFSGGFSVTASNASTGEPEYRAMRAAVREAPHHSLMFDRQTKEPNFPYSMRNFHPAIFGWLTNDSGLLHADTSHLTHVTDSKVFPNIEQRVDTVMGGASVGLSVPK